MQKLEKMINQYPRLIYTADYLLPEIFKAQIRKILFQEKYPLSEPVTISHKHVQAQFWIDNPSDWYRIGRGGFEEGFAEELLDIIDSKHVFWDIGAAQGLYAILAAQAGAKVYAFEPDPVSLNSIKKNSELNALAQSNLTILPFGLGNENVQTEFFIDRKGVQAGSLQKTNKELRERIPIEIFRADSLVEGAGVEPPSIVKIDVEGAEVLVLKGMEKLLHSAHKPAHLFIELHEQFLPQFGSSLQEASLLLSSFNYVPAKSAYNARGRQLQHYISRDQR